MDYYFIAKNKEGEYIGQFTLEDIVQRFHARELPGNYFAARSSGGSYSEVMKSGTASWITVAELINSEDKEANAGNIETQQTHTVIKAEPISTGALSFLRVVGWAVALIGIIAGVVILVNAPKGPSDIVIQYRSDELPVQIQRATRLTYLSLGWGQIISSIVTGVLLNVIAGIGNAVLDIWKVQQSK